jgi:hypothetical protein
MIDPIEIALKGLMPVAFPCPPMLAAAIGSPGTISRLCAYGFICRDEGLSWSNGLWRLYGRNDRPWAILLASRAFRQALPAGVRAEDLETPAWEAEEARWLLVDNETSRLYVGSEHEVRNVLRAQFDPSLQGPLPRMTRLFEASLRECFDDGFCVSSQIVATKTLQRWLDCPRPSSMS